VWRFLPIVVCAPAFPHSQPRCDAVKARSSSDVTAYLGTLPQRRQKEQRQRARRRTGQAPPALDVQALFRAMDRNSDARLMLDEAAAWIKGVADNHFVEVQMTGQHAFRSLAGTAEGARSPWRAPVTLYPWPYGCLLAHQSILPCGAMTMFT